MKFESRKANGIEVRASIDPFPQYEAIVLRKSELLRYNINHVEALEIGNGHVAFIQPILLFIRVIRKVKEMKSWVWSQTPCL